MLEKISGIVTGAPMAFITLSATNVNPIDPALKDIILTAVAALIAWGTQQLTKWLNRKLQK